VSPWAAGLPAGNSQADPMNLIGSLMGNTGGNMANLATSLVAQALQKPGGMMIGGNHFGGSGGSGSGSGYMNRQNDRDGYDDYRRGGGSNYRDTRDYRDNSSSRRAGYRRSRSRSRDRGVNRGSSRRDNQDSSSRNRGGGAPPQKRMRAGSPKDRAPFEIYIGNYPVRFRESDLRNLFAENGVQVSTIRLKHDGHKVFAFAETSSEEEIQKAIKAMDSKEIQGRRLRIRSSKDKDRKEKQIDDDRKKPAPKRELTENDVSRHLVFAFMGFLDRQIGKDGLEESVKKPLEDSKELLKTAFEIPDDDDSLKVSRNLELIFLQNNRREIPIPKDEPVKKDAADKATDEEGEKVEESAAKKEDTEDADEKDADEENKEDTEEVEQEVEEEVEQEVEEVAAVEEAEVEEDAAVEEAEVEEVAAVEEAEVEEVKEVEEEEAEPEIVEDDTAEAEAEVTESEDVPEALPEPVETPPKTQKGGARGRGSARARRSRGRRGA